MVDIGGDSEAVEFEDFEIPRRLAQALAGDAEKRVARPGDMVANFHFGFVIGILILTCRIAAATGPRLADLVCRTQFGVLLDQLIDVGNV